MQELGVRREDNTLPAGPQLQAIIDVIEIHREQHFVHPADIEVVLPARDQTSRGD